MQSRRTTRRGWRAEDRAFYHFLVGTNTPVFLTADHRRFTSEMELEDGGGDGAGGAALMPDNRVDKHGRGTLTW